jgi:hypothetical protein
MVYLIISLLAIYIYALIQNRLNKKREFVEATEELFATVKNTLGVEALENIKEDAVWKDMPDCLLYYVYGRPHHIETREIPGYIYKTWFYRPIENARSNARRKYKTEIYSENGYVTHWDILN